MSGFCKGRSGLPIPVFSSIAIPTAWLFQPPLEGRLYRYQQLTHPPTINCNNQQPSSSTLRLTVDDQSTKWQSSRPPQIQKQSSQQRTTPNQSLPSFRQRSQTPSIWHTYYNSFLAQQHSSFSSAHTYSPSSYSNSPTMLHRSWPSKLFTPPPSSEKKPSGRARGK